MSVPEHPPPGYRVTSIAGDDDVEQLGWHAYVRARKCVPEGGKCFFGTAGEALIACWEHFNGLGGFPGWEKRWHTKYGHVTQPVPDEQKPQAPLGLDMKPEGPTLDPALVQAVKDGAIPDGAAAMRATYSAAQAQPAPAKPVRWVRCVDASDSTLVEGRAYEALYSPVSRLTRIRCEDGLPWSYPNERFVPCDAPDGAQADPTVAQPVYHCDGSRCPGLSYRASDMAHPHKRGYTGDEALVISWFDSIMAQGRFFQMSREYTIAAAEKLAGYKRTQSFGAWLVSNFEGWAARTVEYNALVEKHTLLLEEAKGLRAALERAEAARAAASVALATLQGIAKRPTRKRSRTSTESEEP